MDLFTGSAPQLGGVRLGTSGFSFPDWAGVFYPPGLSPGKRLAFYATRFNALEINASYYRILPGSSTARMADTVPPGFIFCVKLHRSMTHERNAGEPEWKAFHEMIGPFRESSLLGPVLAQFPWSFPLAEQSFEWLREVRGRLGELPAAAEFRHERWYASEPLQRVAETGFVPVAVDLPDLPGLPGRGIPATESFGYARLHGRNREKWWKGGAERYDYRYTPGELGEWAAAIRVMASRGKGAYVFFNNCHMGRAAIDARAMKSMLEESS